MQLDPAVGGGGARRRGEPAPRARSRRGSSRRREAAPRREEEAPAPRAPILVIDDSLTTRMLEQSILESAGYEVDVAVSAEEALDKARARRYGLFIVDVEMPGMDGFEFVRVTRAEPRLSSTPAILVTSRERAGGPRARPGGGGERVHREERVRSGAPARDHRGAPRSDMPIRVLVVEDSLTVRKRLVEVLSADPELEVVGEAEDGQRGIELCQRLRPDVVTLDMMMPVMTGRRRDRVHHGVLPDADPDRVRVDEPRRAVPDLRRARGGRRRRARQAGRDGARRRVGGAAPQRR